MGNGSSKTISVGKKIEDAIKFGIDTVEFDGDVSSSLEKVKPEIEKTTGYSCFWMVKSTVDPFSGSLTESDYTNVRSSLTQPHLRSSNMLHNNGVKSPLNEETNQIEERSSSNMLYNNGIRTTNYVAGTVQKTVVNIRQLKDLKEIPKIDWETAVPSGWF